jgi:hypothetical protein
VSFWKPALQSVYGLLAASLPSTTMLMDSLGEIQERMLNALGHSGLQDHGSVAHRIMYASDIEALWHARGALMAALAQMHGEAHARQTIGEISAEFRGLLPAGLAQRSSPLGP